MTSRSLFISDSKSSNGHSAYAFHHLDGSASLALSSDAFNRTLLPTKTKFKLRLEHGIELTVVIPGSPIETMQRH